MNKSIFRKMFAKYLLPSMAVCMMLGVQSCLDEYAPGQYYTFTGNTVAGFLRDDPDGRFSNFIYTLDQAGILGELDTYGEYTCFAPVNEGFKDFLDARGKTSVDQLTKAQCETIAFTHIIGHLFYCKDLSTGQPLPYANMLDRYLVYEADSASEDGIHWVPVYRLNGAEVIEQDDSVSNGVVHVIAKALNPSNKFLPDIMAEDLSISWFNAALELTGMYDSLVVYMDASYSIDIDSVETVNEGRFQEKLGNETDWWHFPRDRKYKFTAFVEQNSVYEAAGIDSLYGDYGLIEYAKTVYDAGGAFYKDGLLTPEDIRQGYYNDLEESYIREVRDPKKGTVRRDTLSGYTNRNHPLNKFVSYHLLPEELFYNSFNIVDKDSEFKPEDHFVQWNALDVEDFYETMMPHSIMRISTPTSKRKYINRKGAPLDSYNGADLVPGIEIRNMANVAGTLISGKPVKNEFATTNGTYHYINNILTYDKETREKTLNCRIRFMGSTLSPDFINSGSRGVYHADNGPLTCFKMGYAKNIWRTEQTNAYLRYYCKSFDCPRGDEINLKGQFDYAVRLPSVPTDGVYELRLSNYTMETSATGQEGVSDRAIVQIYLGVENEETGQITYTSQGLPLDLAIFAEDPRIGNVLDSDLAKEIAKDPDNPTEEEAERIEEAKRALDKAMHNRGYMKGMDSYTGSNNLRQTTNCIRLILATDNFRSDTYYWLRIRCVSEQGATDKVCAVGCLELVPKSVYDNEYMPEDTH